MAIDVKQYMEQLAQTAGLSPEEKDAILKVATTNEKFSKALGDDILRQQDYSRNMDALKTEKQKSLDYYNALLGWENDVKANIKQLDTYRAVYGELDQNGNPVGRQVVQPVQTDFLNKKDFETELAKRMGERDGQFIKLMKDVGRISSQHAVEFKEPLDTDALEKVAMERNLPLVQAYDAMVSERRAKRDAEATEIKVKQRVEEAVRDFAAKQHVPVDSGAKEFHPFFNPGDPKQTVEYTANTGRLSPTAERQLRSNFVDEWNKAGSGTSGT